MAVNYALLKAELTNDPLALGYSGMSDQSAADALNLVRSGASFQLNREPISRELFIENINPTEFAALTQAQIARLQVILTGTTVNINGTNTQQALLGIFPNSNTAGTTKSNISALLKRSATRAEAVLGAGAVVTTDDVHNARVGAW